MKFSTLAIIAFAIQTSPPCTSSGEVTEVVVFGDSLSDNGNVNALTFGFVPSDDYFGSRVFSNGAPWVRFLAGGLGVTNPDNSQSGSPIATNYAYGGAKSGEGGESFASVVVRNIGQQIDEFVEDDRIISATSLVVLWIGGNDLNGTSSSQAGAQIQTTISNVRAHLTELISLGTRQILVPSVPLLGEVPQHNGNATERRQQNTLTSDYNAALATLLQEMESENSGVRIIAFDVAGIVSELLNDPGALGFTNTTDQAYTPGFLGGSIGSSTVSNPNEYAYWDDLHPTGPVHRLLGERAADAVAQLPVPTIVSIARQEAGTAITFPSKAWAGYSLERSGNFQEWTIVGDALQGTGEEITLVDDSIAEDGAGYYRIRISTFSDPLINQ